MVTSLMSGIELKHPAYNDHMTYLACMKKSNESLIPVEARISKIKEIWEDKFKANNTQYNVHGTEKDSTFITTENFLKNFVVDDDIKRNLPNEKFIIVHTQLDPDHLTFEEVFIREHWLQLEKNYLNGKRLVYNMLHGRNDLYGRYAGCARSHAENYAITLYERYLIWKEINFRNVYDLPIANKKNIYTMIGKILSLVIWQDTSEVWEDGFTMDNLANKGGMFYETHFYCVGNNIYNIYAYYELVFLSIVNQLCGKINYSLLKELLLLCTWHFSHEENIDWITVSGEIKNPNELVDICLYSHLTSFHSLGE